MIKRVKIAASKKGIVTGNGRYLGLLNEGTHWIRAFSDVVEYEVNRSFKAPLNLQEMLKDRAFSEAVSILEVKDNEIALQYENGLFATILMPGKYVFWKGLIEYRFLLQDMTGAYITGPVDKTLLQRKELVSFVRSFTVEPYEKAVLYVDGKFESVLGPGSYYFWKNAVSVALSKADMRTVQMEVAGQEILTKDKAALRISFYAQYQVKDILKALVENKDYEKQLYVFLQLALREFIGALSLDELLERKESVAGAISEHVSGKLEALGVIICGCGIRDVILPGDMKDIMNQVLIAEKKAQANTIMRREETASTRSLLNTAKLMEDNPMLFRLKEMEYVEKIAEKISSISLSGGSQIGEQLKQLFSRSD